MARRLQQLYVHWGTNEGFRRHCLTNRANRVSARSSNYTGGSATFIKTKAKLSKPLSRDATMAETFKYTHTLKENKEIFAFQRSADHYTGEDGNNSIASEVNPDIVWRETASKPYMNHVYGVGSFFADNLCTSTMRPSFASATSRPIDPKDDVNLKEQVLELTRSLHQQAQQLQQSEKRYQEFVTCVLDTHSLRLEWTWELE
ncbi:uncharacterized protein DS421_11g321880 [Arachis hypogaea]|nr:uncharacterized protein DS421_11g321880 [Arachis hypogaea]